MFKINSYATKLLDLRDLCNLPINHVFKKCRKNYFYNVLHTTE